MTTTHTPPPVHDLGPEHPRHRARRWIITALVLAVIAVAAALVATRDDGDEAATRSSTTAPASNETTTSTTTAGGEVDRASAVWPAEGSGIAITDPVAAAQAAEYRINGSCEAFTEWLQYGGCEPRTRSSGG